MYLAHDAICTGSDRCHGHGLYHPAAAGRVARIDDDRQVAHALHRCHRRKIERISRRLLKGTNAALAEDDIMISLRHDVFRTHQPFLDRRRHPALQKHRHMETADRFQKIEVLHISRADLDEVDLLLQEHADLVRTHELRHDGELLFSGRGDQHIEPLLAKSLERVGGRSRLERAAAQHRCAGCLHRRCNGTDLRRCLDGARPCHDDELLPTDLHAGDIDDRVLRMEGTARPLVWFLHTHDLVDPFIAQEIALIEARRISDESQYDLARAAASVDLEALLPKLILKSFDLCQRCILFHNDNHTNSSSLPSGNASILHNGFDAKETVSRSDAAPDHRLPSPVPLTKKDRLSWACPRFLSCLSGRGDPLMRICVHQIAAAIIIADGKVIRICSSHGVRDLSHGGSSFRSKLYQV